MSTTLKKKVKSCDAYAVTTYIWVKDKWLYLATVMDLYSRRIVGWSFGESMTVALIKGALTMAFERREFNLGLIVHSDRGFNIERKTILTTFIVVSASSV